MRFLSVFVCSFLVLCISQSAFARSLVGNDEVPQISSELLAPIEDSNQDAPSTMDSSRNGRQFNFGLGFGLGGYNNGYGGYNNGYGGYNNGYGGYDNGYGGYDNGYGHYPHHHHHGYDRHGYGHGYDGYGHGYNNFGHGNYGGYGHHHHHGRNFDPEYGFDLSKNALTGPNGPIIQSPILPFPVLKPVPIPVAVLTQRFENPMLNPEQAPADEEPEKVAVPVKMDEAMKDVKPLKAEQKDGKKECTCRDKSDDKSGGSKE